MGSGNSPSPPTHTWHDSEPFLGVFVRFNYAFASRIVATCGSSGKGKGLRYRSQPFTLYQRKEFERGSRRVLFPPLPLADGLLGHIQMMG